MQVGCGVYLLTVRRRAYLYFWHYETKGRSRVQVKEYIGPARSALSISEAARRCEGYYERAMAELQRLRAASLATIRGSSWTGRLGVGELRLLRTMAGTTVMGG